MRFLLIAFALLFFSFHLRAQSFTVYNYAVAEGLPSSEVYEVYQDRKGFLWFATDNGVAKFDGSQMETFHTKDGLTDPVVFSFYEDYKNRLWFRTFSGKLCYYENGSLKKYAYNEKLSSRVNGIVDFVVNEKNEIWYAYRNEMGKIDSLGNITASIVTPRGVFYKSVGNEFVVGNSSNAFPADSVIIDDKQFHVSLAPSSFTSRVIRAVKLKDKIFLSVNREVLLYEKGTIKKSITAPYPVISISTDHEGHLWVGYLNGGAERYNANDLSGKWAPSFVKNKSVTKVIQDHEGGLWFSTLENGVFHVPNLLIQHHSLRSTARIRCVLGLPDKILIGDQGGNLFKMDAHTKKMQLVNSIEGSMITFFSDKDRVFISSTIEAGIYDTDLRLKTKLKHIAIDFAKGSDGLIWAFGAYRLRSHDAQNNQVDQVIITRPYRALHIQDSLLFLADRTGLEIRETKDPKRVTVHKDFADVKISNMQQFNDSTVLITTIGKGFILMNVHNLAFKIFNSQNNFIADHIFSSLMINNDLWLGTEKGLIKLPIDQLYKPTFSFEYLTKKSGLISDKIDFLLKIDSSIWAFSDHNFSIIPLSFTMFANKRPLFYIHEIKVNERLIKNARITKLTHRENNVHITFGFISFNNQNILLRYRISANDPWIYTTHKQLLFPSLAPGQYTFDLEYSIDNIHWLSAKPDLAFTITQPWWNMWYAQAVALFFILVLAFLYLRYLQSIYRQKHHYLKIINDHQQKLIQSEIVTRERERNRISKELHDRVGTNLTAIKLTVSQLLKGHKDPQAEEVEEQFQVAIKEIKDIIYGLTPPGLERYGLFTGLKNYVGKLIKTIPINISLKTFGKETHRYELDLMVFRILQELLSNTIKHSYARNITIHINSFDDMLNIMYEDDGIGFAYNPEQSGLGLDNIESRIRSINGSLKFESGNFGISYTIDIPVTLNKEVV